MNNGKDGKWINDKLWKTDKDKNNDRLRKNKSRQGGGVLAGTKNERRNVKGIPRVIIFQSEYLIPI